MQPSVQPVPSPLAQEITERPFAEEVSSVSPVAGDWKRTFFVIWAGQAMSLVGSRVVMFALIWWLTSTTGSATVLATSTLVGLLPTIVLGPIAGVYVDRWNRRLVMLVADGTIALFSLGLAYLFWAGLARVWHVYLLMFVRELGGIFHWPAMASSTSLLVPKEHLSRVAGLNQAMQGVLGIVGPAVGALLISVAAMHHVMFVDVGTAVLAMAPLFFVRIPQPSRGPRAVERGWASVWGDLKEGMHYMVSWRGIVWLSAFAMLVQALVTPAFTLLPILITKHFGKGAPELAALEAAFGIGVIAGGLILGAWGGFRRRIFTVMAGMVLLGCALPLISLLPPALFPFALVVSGIMGASVAIIDGPLFAILQATVAPDVQGRVFMLFISLINVTGPIGLAVAGPVTDAIGVQVWYVAGGLACLLMAVAGSLVPDIVHMEGHGKAAGG